VSVGVVLGPRCYGVGAEVVIAVAFVAMFVRWCSWGRSVLVSAYLDSFISRLLPPVVGD